MKISELRKVLIIEMIVLNIIYNYGIRNIYVFKDILANKIKNISFFFYFLF